MEKKFLTRLNMVKHRNNYILFIKKLTFLFILFSPFFFKLFSIPLILVSLFLMVIYSLNLKLNINSRVKQLFILILFYNCILVSISLLNIDLPQIKTGIYSDPIIPEYINLKQFFYGLFYNNVLFIFLLMYYFFLRNVKQYYYIEKTIFYFSLLNVIFSIIEIFFPQLHHFLMSKAGYKNINYFFIIRPVSIVLNSYINAFFSSFFTFWSMYYWINLRKKIYLILFFLGILATILAGARFSILLLILSLVFYFILLKKIKFISYLIYILFVLVVILIIFSYLNKNYFTLLISIIKISDPSGSANLHKLLMLKTLKICFNHPLGIGIGKADFGALNTIPSFAYNSESFLLTILLQGGIISLFIYIVINIFLIYQLNKIKAYHLISFSIAVLIISLINIQILQSITMTSVIAFIYLPALLKEYYNAIK